MNYPMGPQCEDGYTKIANELLEALAKIRVPGESMQLFLVILRKTYGYGKKEDYISLSQLEIATGIVKSHIPRAIEKLVGLGVITKNGNASTTIYKINKHHDLWQPLPKKVTIAKLPIKVINITNNGNEITNKGNIYYPKRVLQKKKETLQKKKEKGELLPLCFAWKSYIEMRVKIKKPMTENAKKLAVLKLGALFGLGHDPVEVLDQSVFNSWQGLFAIKEQRDNPAHVVQGAIKETRLNRNAQAAIEAGRMLGVFDGEE